ncbi:MAG: hypothetical protein IRY95_08255, partial [Clostridia bacterium]|nr:hypothetical protein [Clostridia bacterium]
HYDLGQTIPSSAEAQVVAEWSLSWEGLGRERLAEIVDAVWEVMRRVDQEYPAPG